MSVPQYTTPTFTLTFEEPNLDLTEANNVYVTFTFGADSLTKESPDLVVSSNSIQVHLSQEETGRFNRDGVDIQANWTFEGGERGASDVTTFPICKQLLKRVIE